MMSTAKDQLSQFEKPLQKLWENLKHQFLNSLAPLVLEINPPSRLILYRKRLGIDKDGKLCYDANRMYIRIYAFIPSGDDMVRYTPIWSCF
jgi:hypothetical protein